MKEERDELKEIRDKVIDVENPEEIIDDSHNEDFQMSGNTSMLEALIEKGGHVFLEYGRQKNELEMQRTKLNVKIEEEELRTIDRMDKREKYFQGILLIVCIIALLLTVAFLKNNQAIVAVLSLIIGLLFKSSSVADFMSFTKRKYGGNSDPE